ncbi:Solute carrier family 2, facilitated glucose transporter member 7 [Toxocara canis]|uniref:Solute carrier family 2, facilitated glucose transporter member 7 n=1 Tax=Toxocara canis TaxID=6265 RepID=A0A0B2VR15_TOXCA|nr:Solute carrier family 2, facilitated glucose transporter member 7 [Toxocara canis]
MKIKKIERQSAYNSWFAHHCEQRNVIITLVIVSFFTIAPVGYHLVVLNVPEKVIQNALNASMYSNFKWSMSETEISILWSVIVSSQSVGALLACLVIVPLRNRHSTKMCIMVINNAVLLVGSVAMSCGAFFEFAVFLIAGRIIIGLYTGLACALLPLFMRELAPTAIKGALSCCMHISACLGAMLAAILSLDFVLGTANLWGLLLAVPAGALSCCMHISACLGAMLAAILSLDFVLGTANLWGLLLAVPAVFGCFQMIGSLFLPDTPNHLLSRGDLDEAVSSVESYYGIKGVRDERSIVRYRELVAKMPEQISFCDAVAERETKWAIFVGMVVSAAQVFCGSMATVSYSTSMFTSVSFVSALVPFMPAFGAVLSALLTLPALYLVEAYGRRLQFLGTLTLCVLSDFFFVLFSLLSQQFAMLGATVWSTLFAFTFFLYGVGYNLGVGPIAYFIPGELVPPEAATVAIGAAVAVNWFSTLITTLIYYPLNVAIGGWSYLLFAAPRFVSVSIVCSALKSGICGNGHTHGP